MYSEYKFEQSWYYHSCMNMRSSTDSEVYVAGIKVDAVVKYRAGYKIWKDATNGGNVHTKTMSSWNEYTIQDGALALAAGFMATSAVSLLF